jgi:hypothetical protein
MGLLHFIRCVGNRYIRAAAALVLMLCAAEAARGQSSAKGLHVGYETLEMAMNEFGHFAGEVGYRFGPAYQIRLTIMEVNLTERHLSSPWEAAAIDGKNVEGYLRGYELHIDRFIARRWYVSGNVGYYEDTYSHTELDESLKSRTLTVGSGVGYTRADLFGIRGLYVNVNIPVRYYLNKIEETRWGDTTVRPHVVVNNIWLFVGYQF